MFATGLLTAQEWRWAHTYGGRKSNDGFDRNRMHRIALDSLGNLYMLGEVGRLSHLDGTTTSFPEPAFGGWDGVATVFAKFDANGNLVWSKQLRSYQNHAGPMWMELQGDRLYVMANTALENTTSGASYIYYWDTLVYRNAVIQIPSNERVLPFKFGRWTVMATFDLDGNLLDNHFVHISNGALLLPLGPDGLFHRDKQNNSYVFTVNAYDSITHFSMDDTPGRTFTYEKEHNHVDIWMYKISSDWQMQWVKPVFHHTRGGYYDTLYHSFINNCFLSGISYDEEDNMYVTGYLAMFSHRGSYEGLNDYPCYIYLDSTEQHYIRVDNDYDAQFKSFIIKYDTNGNVLWVNHPYSREYDHDLSLACCYFFGNQVADSSVYVLVRGISEYNGYVYFDNDTNTALPTTQTLPFIENTGFVRFNKHTGRYLNYGGDTLTSRYNMIAFDNSSLSITNNQVVYSCGDNDFVHLMRFSPTGTLLSKTPICDRLSSTTPLVGAALGYVATDEQGHLALSMHWNDAPDFNLDTVAVHGTQGHSNVIFAMAYDENLTIPYEPPLYTVTTRTTNSNYGHVIGGGSYPEGTSVTLNAIANHNWTHFVRWQDGDTNNPRTFRLTQDTLFTAFFETNDTIGIPSVTANALFTLTPNPAHDYVALDLKDGVSDPKHCTLTVSDASGREVLSLNIAAPHTRINTRDLPKGIYFVTLKTPQGSSTQKLVLE